MRRLVGGTLPVDVPQTAFAAACHDQFLPVLENFAQDGVRSLDLRHRAERHECDGVPSVASVLLCAAAAAAFLAAKVRIVEQADERVLVAGTFQNDVAAAGTVAAIGTAEGDTTFAPETYATVAAVAGECVNEDGVNEGPSLHGLPIMP